MRDAREESGAYLFENLVGIPSHHYDPIFAQAACRAIALHATKVVALELPTAVAGELEWAASHWPIPTAVVSAGTVFPFVPGDSIFEAYRSANARGVRTLLIDIAVADEKGDDENPRERITRVGPEFAPRVKALFLEATDTARANGGSPRTSDVAREARMARALAALMAENERVLWVGGMAHWTRMIGRIANRDFSAPPVRTRRYSRFKRAFLAPSALTRLTGRVPWLVRRYAAEPDVYEEAAATRAMALEAARTATRGDRIVFVQVVGGSTRDDTAEKDPAAPDVARVLLYARNLALTTDVRERPDFGELLHAGAVTVGPRYAGALFETATAEGAVEGIGNYPRLEWEVSKGKEIYRLGGDVIHVRPYRGGQAGLAIQRLEISRRYLDPIADLPAKGGGEETHWECHPEDEESYLAFVDYVLRRASQSDPGEFKAVPFTTGLRDGLDVRATLKAWTKGTIYVQESQRGQLNFTNGAIDWTSSSEETEILTGSRPGGWIDPSLTQLGSCTREGNDTMQVLSRDPWLQLQRREFSMVTLDAPTSAHGTNAFKGRTFYDLVIKPLLALRRTAQDNLYAWLDVMFAFCSGKPFAYYSRYTPSARLHQIAWRWHVRLVHFPLQQVPRLLLERNQTFRFLSLTRAQWEQIQRRRAQRQGMWSSGA